MSKTELRVTPNAKGEVGPIAVASGNFYRVTVVRTHRFRLVDDDHQGVAGERYIVRFSDGTERAGVLDEDGRGAEAQVPGTEATLQFPDLRPDVWGQMDAEG